MQRNKRKTLEWGRPAISSRRAVKGMFHAKMGTIKDKNGVDLTEDTKKRWQEYTKELYKTDLMIQITTMM